MSARIGQKFGSVSAVQQNVADMRRNVFVVALMPCAACWFVSRLPLHTRLLSLCSPSSGRLVVSCRRHIAEEVAVSRLLYSLDVDQRVTLLAPGRPLCRTEAVCLKYSRCSVSEPSRIPVGTTDFGKNSDQLD